MKQKRMVVGWEGERDSDFLLPQNRRKKNLCRLKTILGFLTKRFWRNSSIVARVLGYTKIPRPTHDKTIHNTQLI